jgi:hypothetical protein
MSTAIEGIKFPQIVYSFMGRVLLIMVCLALFSGCIEQKEDLAQSEEKSPDKVTVTINSPRGGQILQGDKEVLFEARAEGGKGPYSYRWSSNLEGELSTIDSFRYPLSDLAKGRHTIIVEAKDANGISGRGSVQINVM